jgi:hypothetical protein
MPEIPSGDDMASDDIGFLQLPRSAGRRLRGSAGSS